MLFFPSTFLQIINASTIKTPSFPQSWWCGNVVIFTRFQSVPGGWDSHLGLETCSETNKIKEWKTHWGNGCNPHSGVVGSLQGGHFINVTVALDHALIIWQCCYSGLYWTSRSLSLLSTVGPMCGPQGHTCRAKHLEVRTWGLPCVCFRGLSAYLLRFGPMDRMLPCGWSGLSWAVLLVGIVPSATAQRDPSCPHSDARCELGEEQEWSGDLPHVPDPNRNDNVDTDKALHSLHLPPAAALVSWLFNH